MGPVVPMLRGEQGPLLSLSAHLKDAQGPCPGRCCIQGNAAAEGRGKAACAAPAARFQGKFALSQLLKRNVSECQMPGATYALHKRGSINQGAVSGKKSGSKEESSGTQFFFS